MSKSTFTCLLLRWYSENNFLFFDIFFNAFVSVHKTSLLAKNWGERQLPCFLGCPDNKSSNWITSNNASETDWFWTLHLLDKFCSSPPTNKISFANYMTGLKNRQHIQWCVLREASEAHASTFFPRKFSWCLVKNVLSTHVVYSEADHKSALKGAPNNHFNR